MVESSDNERKQSTQSTLSTCSTSDTQGSSPDVAIQQVINVQILSQLSAISDRLQVLEKIMQRKIQIRKKLRELPK